MKIQIASDLHLEFVRDHHPDATIVEHVPGADVLVLAGDIDRGYGARRLFTNWPVPVLWVAGNHEFYGAKYHNMLNYLAQHPDDGTTHYLEKRELVIGDVRFLGATLWTDYRLDGNAVLAKLAASRSMNDHRAIRFLDRNFRPGDAQSIHSVSRRWLAEKLGEPFAGKTVAITHHGVHPDSVHPMYARSDCNAAFSSDLSELMGKADLWIHGHTHSSCDYVVNGTRVVVNPSGYCHGAQMSNLKHATFENVDYNPNLVIEV